MRIGIDARELCGRPTGVGRYLDGLLTAWAGDPSSRHEFILYAHREIERRPASHSFVTRTVAGTGGTWWEQRQLPATAARDHLDVLFSPAYSAPLRTAIPSVLALHDLSFVAHPEWFTTREGVRRRWLARQSAAQARAIVTISQFSKGEIVDRLGVPADRVHVIPPGVTSPLKPTTLAGGAGPPRVLYAGSVFNRRHVPDLIRAFAPISLAHPSAVLDIVGDNRTYPRQDLAAVIAAEGLQSSVRWRQYVTDEELGGLFASVRTFAFLSEYEGLGLTPLEALAAGVPPLLLDTAVARESCGDAALYVARDDVRGTTEALTALLFDSSCRARLLAAAPATLARYNWPKAAQETLAVLERASSVSFVSSVVESS